MVWPVFVIVPFLSFAVVFMVVLPLFVVRVLVALGKLLLISRPLALRILLPLCTAAL